MTSTFTDTGQTLEDFADIIYVCCPVCKLCAHVTRIPSDEEKILEEDTASRYQRSFSPRKLTCFHCGYTKMWQGKGRGSKGPRDWYFGLPLWLQTPCCGEILWAFNKEHISFLERYASATQRIKFHANGPIRNGTMASRLPLWIKSAKNRDEVIKGITQLRGLLEQR